MKLLALIVAVVSLSACGGGAAILPGHSLPQGSVGAPTATPLLAPLSACAPLALPVPEPLGTNPSPTAPCAISEPGYVGPFVVSVAGCSGVATVDSTPMLGPSATLTITQVGPGVCSLTVSDANGQSATVRVSSTWTVGIAT